MSEYKVGRFKFFLKDNYCHIAVLFLILLVGMYLRFHNLGALSLWNNEDYLAISVRSILENGYPLFPTGIVYPRALPYSYTASLFVELFGFSEASLRAPGAIFSTTTIILTYIFARQTVGKSVALLAAAIISVFYWDVYSAQMARMYAMFTFSVLLSLVAVHAVEVEGKARYRSIAFIAIILSAFLHQLAIALVIMLMLYVPYFYFQNCNPKKLLPYILVLIISILINKLVGSYYYDQFHELVGPSQGISPVSNFYGNNLILTIMKSVAPLQQQLLSSLSGFEKVSYYVLGVFLFWLPFYFTRNIVFRLTFGVIVLSLLFQLIFIGIGSIAFLLFSRLWLKDEFLHQKFLISTLIMLTGIAFWFAFAFISNGELTIKDAIKLVIPYPPMFFRIFFENFTLLTAIFLISGLYIVREFYISARLEGIGFVLSLFLLPLIALSFHPMALDRVYERYVYFLTPFYIVVISFGCIEFTRYVSKQCMIGRSLLAFMLGLLFFVLIFFSREEIFTRSYFLANKHYGENEAILDNWTGKHYFHPDVKGGSLFVAENYSNNDVIMAMDVLAHYVYFPKVDYQITVSAKKDAEGWIGVRSINTSVEFKDALSKYADRRVWVITSALHLRDYASNIKFKEILSVLDKQAGAASYIAQDGLTKVYCLGCY